MNLNFNEVVTTQKCAVHGEYEETKTWILGRQVIASKCPDCLAEQAAIAMAAEETQRLAAEAALAASRERRIKRMIAESGVPPRHQQTRLRDWLPEPDGADHRQAITGWIRAGFAQPNIWRPLVLTGATGTGKSMLACVVANAFAGNDMRAKYINASALIERFRASNRDGAHENEGRIYGDLDGAAVLVIDELSRSPQTPYATGILFEVINRRYEAGRLVVVVSNDSLDTLASRGGDWEAITSRLRESATHLPIVGVDKRGASNSAGAEAGNSLA